MSAFPTSLRPSLRWSGTALIGALLLAGCGGSDPGPAAGPDPSAQCPVGALRDATGRTDVVMWYQLNGKPDEVLQSQVLAGIDLLELASYLDRPTASQAIREYRAALRARGA